MERKQLEGVLQLALTSSLLLPLSRAANCQHYLVPSPCKFWIFFTPEATGMQLDLIAARPDFFLDVRVASSKYALVRRTDTV